ncbi:MAG: type II toxin-antitoxin system RelB/DinJ family antitoxin [Propionibacteriaceae bacterium]|jgi:DNA-damage-inducible protein J|nr:type II toxin-antitoxin system RelB/DinJ family antitoxin [Propionibacteriaceae bacterium]
MTAIEMDRISTRVNRQVKRDAESILESLGLNLSDAVNIFLRRVVAERGIPFALTQTRSQTLGAKAAALESAAAQAVRDDIDWKATAGAPIARYDVAAHRPYLEYPDGRKVYTLDS